MYKPAMLRWIEAQIHIVRSVRVMLDEDLANLYGVSTRVLNQAVSRNLERFPSDFMFRLTAEEALLLRSQTVISKKGRGGRRHFPLVFTEQGVAMLSGILNSPRAIRVNIEIMRTFVQLRMLTSSHTGIARKIDSLERKYDSQLKLVFEALKSLMANSPRQRRRIGFRPPGGLSGSRVD